MVKSPQDKQDDSKSMILKTVSLIPRIIGENSLGSNTVKSTIRIYKYLKFIYLH